MKYQIRTVADVRRLACCAKCGELGQHRVDLLLVKFTPDSRGRKRDKVFAHAKCISENALLTLPAEELGNVRMCDVSVRMLKRIVEKLRESER